MVSSQRRSSLGDALPQEVAVVGDAAVDALLDGLSRSTTGSSKE
jgi:hypothetical protein